MKNKKIAILITGALTVAGCAPAQGVPGQCADPEDILIEQIALEEEKQNKPYPSKIKKEVAPTPPFEEDAESSKIRGIANNLCTIAYTQDVDLLKTLLDDKGFYALRVFEDSRERHTVIFLKPEEIQDYPRIYFYKESRWSVPCDFSLSTRLPRDDPYSIPIHRSEELDKLAFKVNWTDPDYEKMEREKLIYIITNCMKIVKTCNDGDARVFVLGENSFMFSHAMMNEDADLENPSMGYNDSIMAGQVAVFEKNSAGDYVMRAIMKFE